MYQVNIVSCGSISVTCQC